jgi:hypothetical protein
LPINYLPFVTIKVVDQLIDQSKPQSTGGFSLFPTSLIEIPS